jgi:hypothetical protein
MEAAVPLPSPSSVVSLRTLLTLLLAGCATAAPPLPPDTTGVNSQHHLSLADFSTQDAAMSCVDIAAERSQITAQLHEANANIQANRTKNQVAGYIGVVAMPLALLATEGNDADKQALQKAYARQDTLIELGHVKAC